MSSRKNTILASPGGVRFRLGLAALVGLALGGCSSAPIKVECQELQARIDYGDLTGDQLRFAAQELADCRQRVDAAERRDSAFIEGTEKRFTPADSL